MIIEFGGWFQTRMASDPDPTQEKRGISGCSFAIPGEPDLDRIIRMQESGTTLRSFSPAVGVEVCAVSGKVTPEVKRRLLGSRVELAGKAKFVEQNGAVVPRNTAFIDPFDLRIYQDDDVTLLRRKAVWNVDRPDQSFLELPSSVLAPRQPKLEINSTEVLQRSGVNNVDDYWSKRRVDLKQALDDARSNKPRDPVLIAGIEQRLENLELDDWRNQRLHTLLAARAVYDFPLQELAHTTTIADELKSEISAENSWQMDFWMGAWDNDALCGYLYGKLHLPHNQQKSNP